MKTILVIGGAGFIGSNFIIYITKKYPDYEIINFDKLTSTANLANLSEVENKKNYKFFQGDICDKRVVESIFENNKINFVVNFAVESLGEMSIMDQENYIKTNVLGTMNLLNVSMKSWFEDNCFKKGSKFIQVSTDEVYGSLGDTGYFSEETTLDPHSPYAASKAGADLLVKSYYDNFHLPVNITRCSNNYGPYQFPEKLIPLIINNILKGKPLPIYGDGMNIRDWLFVEDHCTAIDLVMHFATAGEIYNIGGNNERSNIDIINIIVKLLKENSDKNISEPLIKYIEDRKVNDRRYGIDASKIRGELGWVPKTTFEEGIIKTIKWYLENTEWLKRLPQETTKIII